jgi:hypothetical protein
VDILPNQEVECAMKGVRVDFHGELGIKGGEGKHISENNKISEGKGHGSNYPGWIFQQ